MTRTLSIFLVPFMTMTSSARVQLLYRYQTRIKNIRIQSNPGDERWNIGMIEGISLLRKNFLELNVDKVELEEMFDFISTA